MKVDKLFFTVISSLSALIVLAGLVIYTPMLDLSHWLELLVLLCMLIFCLFRGMTLPNNVKLSLAVAVYLAVLFVYGTGEAMWLSMLSSLVYGLLIKASLRSTWLNAVQRALTALIIGNVFCYLHGGPGNLAMPSSLGPMFICVILYSSVNWFIVSLFLRLVYRQSLESIFSLMISDVWFNCLLFGYVGMIFAFFIQQWQLPGILVFSVVIIGISEIMRYSLHLITEQQQWIKAQQELYLDSKTKVYNYRYFSQWLNQDSDECEALLFIDIDDFKVINDNYGHYYGDKALYTVAQTIYHSVRAEDQVVRFGGEEFVVILPKANRTTAVQVAKRIQTNLADQPLNEIGHPITVSIGVAVYPDDAKNRLELLRAADMAMYRAKSMGKNQCCSSG